MPDPNTEVKEKEELTEEADRFPDVVNRRQPKTVVDHHIKNQNVSFISSNGFELRLTIHTPEIIQLTYIFEDDQASDFSYAIDPDFIPKATKFQVDETDTHFQLRTDAIECHIAKKNLMMQFYDRDANVLCEDKKPLFRRDTIMKGLTKVKITHNAPKGMSYFGLGDKICEEGLRGESFENWNTDAYAYERDDKEPLYRTIPFYTAVHRGRAFGIFMDNSYRSHFDFDSKKNNTSSFSAAGGCMNYYFIYGPELTTVSERYTQLTGTPELPPMWALGYHQCRWSYFPDSRVRELANTFREKQIPCDAIYLDIDYMDGYRCFTWDNDYFPDPESLIEDLKKQGFETIVMIDPGIKADKNYEVYRQGLTKGHFCKRPDGEVMFGPVWPSKCAFPDFTNPNVREWWGELYQDLMANKKISGIWNDMNEPAVFEVESKTFPEDVRHDHDGHPCSHKKAHNIYGMQMVRASLRGIKKYNDGKRPFLLSRANYSGGQRYAALWTGDNIANWDHLKLANEQCQRLSISGYSFVGSDIGGFVKKPSGELFSRWLQLSVFHPLFRNHTMGYNVDGAAAVKQDPDELQEKKINTDQEPWTFGKKYTKINRSVIELRYRLLPYLYTAFQKHVEHGTPILRPLSYFDQTDETAIREVDEFLFGEQILVSPVLDKKKRKVETYFPKGQWYDFRNNKVYEGRGSHTIKAPLEEIPFFIKAGTVLPLREVMQYTQERDPDYLELNVYAGNAQAESTLYEDAEEGYGYKDSEYRRTTFRLDPQKDYTLLTADRTGSFQPSYQNVKINLIGLPFEPSSVFVDDTQAEFSEDQNTNSYSLTIPAGFDSLRVEK